MRALIITIFSLLASTASGTEQYPDKIVYEGKECIVIANRSDDYIMAPYFAKHPYRKPGGRIIWSTALRRGYVATFELKENSLFLKEIEVEVGSRTEDGKYIKLWKSAREDVMPDGKELLVDWYTGILVVPSGKVVRDMRSDYLSTFGSYVLLRVEKGRLTGKCSVDEEEMNRQFLLYKQTDEYKKKADELKESEREQKVIDLFLSRDILSYMSGSIKDLEPTGDSQPPPAKPAKKPGSYIEALRIGWRGGEGNKAFAGNTRLTLKVISGNSLDDLVLEGRIRNIGKTGAMRIDTTYGDGESLGGVYPMNANLSIVFKGKRLYDVEMRHRQPFFGGTGLVPITPGGEYSFRFF